MHNSLRNLSLAVIAPLVTTVLWWLPARPVQGSSTLQYFASTPAAVINKYCVTCHNQRQKTAGLMLDSMDVANVGDNPAAWEKVVRKLRGREMPPPGAARPDEVTYVAVISGLEKALDKLAESRPNPGRVAVHRLNRTEYANAVRDLLGIEIDGQSILSGDIPDRQSFDNMASVLSVSPALLENYLSAARSVSRLAVGDPKGHPPATYKIAANWTQDDRMSEDLPFGSQGGLAVRHYFPRDGQYKIKVRLRRQLYDYIIGMGEPHQIDIRLDGVRIKRFTIGGEAKGMTTPETFPGDTQGDLEWEVYMHNADDGLEVLIPVKAGTREVAASFVSSFWEPEGIVQPPQIESFARTDNEVYFGNPGVGTVSIDGPIGVTDTKELPPGTKVFSCWPNNAGAEEPCARKILSSLATRAYRRPVNPEEVRTLLDFYHEGHAEAGFVSGIQLGLERILAAPSFLFRVEHERIDDLDLASRLSFFLWSSIPDRELLDLATHGKLHEPAMLEAQVRRMLNDSRSSSLVENFAKQWLKLDVLSGVAPDIYEYSEFDENLRAAMQDETRLLISSQLTEDRSVIDLISANYTYLNERLAQHYGVPNVYGSHFRRVTFEDGIRGGLLGQGSILTVTSYPNRTSPVLRGKWLLEALLGSPIPPPPPNVPALKEGGADGQPRSVRERMELHRKNPVCAGCHQRMDPLGFALENFDALGKWRTVSDGAPVDARAALPDGSQFEGVPGLRKLLVGHREDFVRTFTEKLLAYALGRGLESYDYPAVRNVMRKASANDYRWSAIIVGIVESVPFSVNTANKSARGEQ